MARKKTPPEYGESDCGQSQYIVIIACSASVSQAVASGTSGGRRQRNETTLTGPMMVACQWNCQRPKSVYAFRRDLDSVRQGLVLIPDRWDSQVEARRTRSSPMGPAEHDDGGSLQHKVESAAALDNSLSQDTNEGIDDPAGTPRG